LDRRSGGPKSGSEGFGDKKEFFLSSVRKRTQIPVSFYPLSYSLYRQTVGQTSKIKVNHFPFIGLNSLLVTDENAVGLTDRSDNVEHVAESGCWKS
jgi:hypothetical protein